MNQNTELKSETGLSTKIIPIKKFFVYSIFSLGLFQFYFGYKIWKEIKEEKNLDIYPIMRCIFFPLFSGSLARHINKMAEEKEYTKSINSMIVFLGCFIGNSINRKAHFPFDLMGLLIIIGVLIPVIQAYNFYWLQKEPNLKPNTKFSPTGIFIIILGIIITLLSAIPENYLDSTNNNKIEIQDDNN
ncbi:MAG: hypothetical protein U0354_17685 [Candidatus Sericytochromatia bacterium]